MKRIDIVANLRSEHQPFFLLRLKDGLERHGIATRLVGHESEARGDWVACWGWRQGAKHRARGRHVLLAERGYLGNRFRWSSLAFDGLNGRGIVPPAPADGGRRFREHHGALLRHWRPAGGCRALIMGQVPNDASLDPLNGHIAGWAAEAAAALRARGYEVRYRPHPVEVERATKQGRQVTTPPIPLQPGALDHALAAADLVVTFNSNSAVDAALAGVPVVVCDEGSMAWPIAAQGLQAKVVRPDREAWAAALAWRQWSPEELADGTAWEHLRAALPN